MNCWKDIYEQSERIWRDILRNIENDTEEDKRNEHFIRFNSAPPFTERIQRQEKYDAFVAYKRLQTYRRRLRIKRYSIAAGILLITTLGVGLLWSKEEKPLEVAAIHRPPEIQPGSPKAILTLADGTIMQIQDSLLNSGNIKKYLPEAPKQQGTPTSIQAGDPPYHTVFIPRGGEFFLTLPDSTRVWLNSETELRFPAWFAKDVRSVTLKGEAYFEVAPDKQKPFHVCLDKGRITVFGTQFCISAYEQSDLLATLVEGSIGFQSPRGEKVKLLPSHQLVYTPETEKMIIRQVDTRNYTSWKEHLFNFEEQSLEEIMKTLARWYDVELIFETPQLRQLKMSGTLDKYEKIEPLLKLFEAGQKVSFDIQGKKIIIRQRKEN